MTRAVHLRVVGKLDSAGPRIEGTITINRRAGLFIVRPLRRHRTYELPLDVVADMVVGRVTRAEVFKRRLERANGKAAR